MLEGLKVKIFADGADLDTIYRLADDPLIEGFTTNPSLMWQQGLTDYREFAKRVLDRVPVKPVSFEAFADTEAEIKDQVPLIQGWGGNVFVKIPVTTTRGEPLAKLCGELASSGFQVNVTAVMTLEQVEEICLWRPDHVPGFISLFAGRIADAGVDPLPIVRHASAMAEDVGAELIWASPREVLNVVQADRSGCHAITLTEGLIDKLPLLGKDLGDYSLETVQMFYNDARKAGYRL